MCIYHLCVLCTCVAYIYIYGMCMYKPEIDVGLFLYHSLPYSPGQFLSLHLEHPNLTGIADQQTPKTLLPLLPQRATITDMQFLAFYTDRHCRSESKLSSLHGKPFHQRVCSMLGSDLPSLSVLHPQASIAGDKISLSCQGQP